MNSGEPQVYLTCKNCPTNKGSATKECETCPLAVDIRPGLFQQPIKKGFRPIGVDKYLTPLENDKVKQFEEGYEKVT